MWIQEKKYKFDYADITTLAVVVGVVLTICGLPLWAGLVFVINSVAGIVLTCKYTKRINLVVLNIALLVLNIFYLI
jgi:hypothetical protein